MNNYIKLAAAPTWCIQYPTCSACLCELELNDGWTCPVCGTSWSVDASDGDLGELYASWSGEEPGGPAATEDQAAEWADYLRAKRLHEQFPNLPNLFPAPRRPTFTSDALRGQN